MIKFSGQEKAKRKFYKKVIWTIVLLLIVFLIKPTWKIWQKYRMSEKELERTANEIKELTQRQERLEVELEELNTQIGKEKEVIKKFDLVKEGEKLAVIIDPPENLGETETNEGFFKRFFKKYFGWLGLSD
ncbi:MAG: hypothetical protein AAB534_00370 [Patescibacteria group bacterium]